MAWEKNTFMERIYLFGAGKNGENAIRFWGKENIIAIIDNSINQIGRKINGLSVISLQDCLEKYKGEIIVITSVYYSSEIKKQLDKVDITNVFVCPFFDNNSIDPINIVNNYNLYDYNKIIIEKNNPILYRIADILKESYKETNIEIICSNQLETKDDDLKQNEIILTIRTKNLKNELCLFDNNIDYREFIYLEKYKDVFRGQRCFIVGNGPSLNVGDLERIKDKGIVSFASNGIYKIYQDTSWRPKYYFYGDVEAFKRANNIQKDQIYFMSDLFKDIVGKSDNINFFHHIFKLNQDGSALFSDNIVKGVSGGRTITYVMLQFAIYMGFKEIYLLGVDFSWGEHGENTHFCNDYVDPQYEQRIRENVMHKDKLIKNYECANRFAEEHGVKIYNATRGGYLEVFERIDFDLIFKVRGK
jgi:uncharacterized Rossmann fold enzyme